MKVAWVHDHLLDEIPDGGAQISNDKLIQTGRERGHQVDIFTPKNTTEDIMGYDLISVHNAKFFTHKHLLFFIRHPMVVKHEHDYWNLVDPSQEGSKSEIWKNSKLGVFLSPGQHQTYKRLMPWLQLEPYTLSPSPVDVEAFQDLGKHSEDIVVCVSSMSQHKGTINAARWAQDNPNYKVHFYGRPAHPDFVAMVNNVPNAEYKGVASLDEMPEIYNNAYGLIHMPQWMEPCGRSVIEARLCGCKLFLNERIGVATYSWWSHSDSEFREIIKDAPIKLWEEMEKTNAKRLSKRDIKV